MNGERLADCVDEPGAPSVAIIGAGAIAGIMALWLKRAGHQPPMVCARNAFDAFTVVGDGLGDSSVERCPVRVITTPTAAVMVDWVFITVKAHDTESTKPWLDALLGPNSTVVVLQNGVDHLDRVKQITGSAQIVPSLVFAAAERTAPTMVHLRLGASLTVPNTTAGRSFAELMSGGVHVTTSDDFVTDSWLKLLVNIGASPITALTLRHASVLREPDVELVCARLLTETRSVGNAIGAHLTDVDVDNVMGLYRSYPDEVGSSMLDDRLAGRRLESELLFGVVINTARQHNIDVPVAETLYALTAAAHPPTPDIT
ncbi:2-dehydropantoate 2-reductase [Williamsia maris]|uniref:2-dehydropantoate 2-reductase n=1 Tax=Williamsia maris TaxID=72806 RepID=A0ABT1HJJ6_9NOCA|nr:2-dehydropantoate 2-reductase [Williamsia maris]MCP2178098.1 2-dehydropantoate 2-reductase [Williamsia maris]